MTKRYYSLEANETEKTAEVVIFGDITSWPWLESDVSSYNLSQKLQGLDVDKIDVHINSYGGEVAEALAIYNTLRRHKAEVTTYVDGFACSAATVIFMAGDRRVMSPVGNFLVHPASIYTSGNAGQLRKEADNLDAITEQSITAYMQSVTKSREELIGLMDEDRFLTPEEVLEWGFATEIEELPEDEKQKQSVAGMVNALLHERLNNISIEVDPDKIAGMVADKLKGYLEPQKDIKETGNIPGGLSYMDRLKNAFK